MKKLYINIDDTEAIVPKIYPSVNLAVNTAAST